MSIRNFLGQEQLFPSPCSWVRDSSLQSSALFLMDACFFKLAGRVQLPEAAMWSEFIPWSYQRLMATL